MANPNIVNVASIYGKSAVASLTTSMASLLANAAASGKFYKINTFFVVNIDGGVSATADIKIIRSSSDYYLIKGTAIPAGSSLVLVSKDSSIYLNEGDDIQGLASAAGDLQTVISYEEIA